MILPLSASDRRPPAGSSSLTAPSATRSIGHQITARVPFLDHELVELAARVPTEMKVQTTPDGRPAIWPRVNMRWQRQPAPYPRPHAVIDRPEGYFPVPALKHLEDDPYLEMVCASLGRGPVAWLVRDQATVDRLLAVDQQASLLSGGWGG